jgi:dethiobiotin synthetase
MNHRFVISGIGSGVGKTVVSAILTKALNASYWKPIQSGDLDCSDSITVAGLVGSELNILPEAFRLTQPLSPHASAKRDGIHIHPEALVLPEVEGNLIIEGAGGLCVPMKDQGDLLVDVYGSFGLPFIVVSRHYLGSINHTLLTIAELKRRNIAIEGIIFVGEENHDTESIILNISGCSCIGRIPVADELTPQFIVEQADNLKGYFHG